MNRFVTMERQILVALVDLTGESRPPPEVAQDVPGTDLWRRTGIMFQWHYIESILVLQIISSKGMCNQTSTECNTCIMIERASTEELRKRKTAPRWNIETLALQGKSCWDCVVREACTIINIKPVSTVRFILDFFSYKFSFFSILNCMGEWNLRESIANMANSTPFGVVHYL